MSGVHDNIVASFRCVMLDLGYTGRVVTTVCDTPKFVVSSQYIMCSKSDHCVYEVINWSGVGMLASDEFSTIDF